MVGLFMSAIAIRKHEKVFEDVSTIGCKILMLFPQRCQAPITHLNSCLHIELYQATLFYHSQLLHETHSTVVDKRTYKYTWAEEQSQSKGYKMWSFVWDRLVIQDWKWMKGVKNMQIISLFLLGHMISSIGRLPPHCSWGQHKPALSMLRDLLKTFHCKMRLFSGVTEGLETQIHHYLQTALDTLHRKGTTRDSFILS